MSTPEAKIKKMVKEVLAKFTEGVTVGPYHVANLYQYWPVPTGFGASSLDCIVAYYGRALFIETKAPGKRPTPRQQLTIAEIKGAHSLVLVIDGAHGCHELEVILGLIRDEWHDGNS